MVCYLQKELEVIPDIAELKYSCTVAKILLDSLPFSVQSFSMNLNSRLPHIAGVAALILLVANGVGQAQGTAAQATTQSAKFDTREIRTGVEPGVEVVDLCYEFTNTGEIPLVVEEFLNSCGCMQGGWDGVPVAPGARGKITAKFLTKGLRGTVRKSLHVSFVEGGAVELVAEVRIAEALTYSAQTLRWSIGEALRSQQVDIVISSKAAVRVLSVSGNSPAFGCELVTVDEGRAYRIIVTPRDTAAEDVCVLQVRTDSKDPRDAVHGLFALVERPKPQGGRP